MNGIRSKYGKLRSAYKNLGGKQKLAWQVIRDKSLKVEAFGWINLALDKVQWHSFMRMVTYYESWKFLDSIRTCQETSCTVQPIV